MLKGRSWYRRGPFVVYEHMKPEQEWTAARCIVYWLCTCQLRFHQ